MDEFSETDLFNFKAAMEAQFERNYVEGVSAEKDGSFNFLIGEWDLVRRSFGLEGHIALETKGTVIASYVFDGRIIQEDFFNYREDGQAYRGGVALYTFSPSTGSWAVAAVDASTGATSYQPEWVEGEVHYQSVVNLPGREVHTKSRIFNISNDSYEWEQKVSLDGEMWHKNYHILNHRKR